MSSAEAVVTVLSVVSGVLTLVIAAALDATDVTRDAGRLALQVAAGRWIEAVGAGLAVVGVVALLADSLADDVGPVYAWFGLVVGAVTGFFGAYAVVRAGHDLGRLPTT